MAVPSLWKSLLWSFVVVSLLSLCRPTATEDDKMSLMDLFEKYAPRRTDMDLSRPGTCPSVTQVSRLTPSRCDFVCLFDLECPDAQRCCPDDCGGATCAETTEQKEEVIGTPTPTQPPSSSTATTVAATAGSDVTPDVDDAGTTTLKPQQTEPTRIPTTTVENNQGLYLVGDPVVNVTVIEGGVVTLHCNVSAPEEVPVVIFWLVAVGNGYRELEDVLPSDNKRVTHEGASLEIRGAREEDSQTFVCLAGHLTGYLTQSHIVTVTEKPDVDKNVSCADHICLNGGTCIGNVTHTHRCICSEGYEGDVCEIAADLCGLLVEFCHNGGTCVATGHRPKCECPAGWRGRRCEEVVDPCNNRPCRNGGECVAKDDGSDGFRCVCPPSFKGARCQKPTAGEETTTQASSTTPTTAVPPSTLPMSNACHLPLAQGTCARKESKWYYDVASEQCRLFVYSGCGGNDNRFRSYQDCRWACPRLPDDPCSHPIVTGRCRARIPRWAYNADEGRCVQFVYGGCSPNGNNFLSERACKKTCLPDRESSCDCSNKALTDAVCDSDFVVTGILRHHIFSGPKLVSLVFEVTKTYKGDRLDTRRSRFFDRPLLVVHNGLDDCDGGCLDDLEAGKAYILSGYLKRQDTGREARAFLTGHSYIKPAAGKRLEKLERLTGSLAFQHRCRLRMILPI